MNIIIFKVKGNRLTRVGGFDPVSGESGYSKLRFEFDEEWAGVETATVTMFFDVRNSFNALCTVADGVAEVDIDENLRNISGIMWVGITGVDTESGATLDCVLTAVPVGQGCVVTEVASTKLYQQIIELFVELEGKQINEDNPITTSLIQDLAVTPDKLDRAYWEKKAPVGTKITDRAVLFDTVGFTNTGGGITFVNVNMYVADLETTINGYCYAIGVRFVNGDTIYLINVTDGSMWKINRYNEGEESVPVYTYDFVRQTVGADTIEDGAVTEEKLFDGAVTENKLAPRAVGTDKLKLKSVDSSIMADGAINTEMLFSTLMGKKYLSMPVSSVSVSGNLTDDYLNTLTTQGIYQVSSQIGDRVTVIVFNPDSQNHLMQIKLSYDSFMYRGIYASTAGEYLAEEWTEWVDMSDRVSKSKVMAEGAKITLTIEQIDALDKLFDAMGFQDGSTAAALYSNFVTAFGLDKYRAIRMLEGSELLPCGVSSYYDISKYNDAWQSYNGIPYTYVRIDGTLSRTCYPYFDIPAEGGYSYQIYYEANDDVTMCLEFYNQNVLDAVANGENWNAADKKDGYGWQTSMGYEWTPPTEHNGSPIKAMRLIFNNVDAGVQKVIIYRKKVL